MRRFSFLLILLFLLTCNGLLLPCRSAYAQDLPELMITLDSSIISKNYNSGDSDELTVTVKNEGKSDAEVSVELISIDDVEKDGKVQLERSSPAFSLWISFDNTEKIIRAGDSAEFNVKLAVPVGSKTGGYSGVILFRGESSIDEGEGMNIKTGVEVGCILLLNVFDEESSGSLSIGEWKAIGGGIHKVELSLTVDNDGEYNALPLGIIQIKDSNGTIVDTNALEDHWLLPGSFREYIFHWMPKSAFGKYSARIMLYGDDGNVVEQDVSFLLFQGSGIGLLILCTGLAISFICILIKLIFSLGSRNRNETLLRNRKRSLNLLAGKLRTDTSERA